MRGPLDYPKKKFLHYPSVIDSNENFCNFLENYDYNLFDVKYKKLLKNYELKKEHLEDLKQIKLELQNDGNFVASNWGELSLHLLTLIKNTSKLILDLIPQGQTLSVVEEFTLKIINDCFSKNSDFFEKSKTEKIIIDSLNKVLKKYKPLLTIADFTNQLVKETIKNDTEIKKFQKDFSNLISNFDKQIQEYNFEVQQLINDIALLQQLKEDINNYYANNCLRPKMASM